MNVVSIGNAGKPNPWDITTLAVYDLLGRSLTHQMFLVLDDYIFQLKF